MKMKKCIPAAVSAFLAVAAPSAWAICNVNETGSIDMSGVWVCGGCSTAEEMAAEIHIWQNGATFNAQSSANVGQILTYTLSKFTATGPVNGTVRNDCNQISFTNNTHWVRRN